MPTPPETTRGFGRSAEASTLPGGQGKNYLLAIAIETYTNLPTLPNAVLDAKAVVKLLTTDFGFESANVIELYDTAATERAVLRQLRELASLLTPADNLVVYFSGHGGFDTVTNEGTWLPVAAEEDALDTHLPNGRIHTILKVVKARHIFVICDACYAGSFFSRYRNTTTKTRLEKLRSRWGLTAGRKEVVKDGLPGTHSPFAQSLLRHLRSVDEKIGVAELCGAVLEEVASNNEQLPRGEPLQDLGHEGGQFFFRRKKEAPPRRKPHGDEQGHLLYNIPERMQANQAARCEVRIALDDAQLLRDAGFDPATSVVKSVHVSDTMGVQLIDPIGNAFRINSITQEEQFIHPKTYTQWVFYVTPLRTGKLPLVVTVAMIEQIDGVERSRQLVLEETIEVIAELPERTAVGGYKIAGYQFTVTQTQPAAFEQVRPDTTATGGGGGAVSPAPVRPQARIRSLRPILSGIAAVLLVGMAVWFLVPRGIDDESTIRSPTNELPRVEPSVPDDGGATPPLLSLEENRWRGAVRTNTVAAYQSYLADYPNGAHAAEARQRIRALQPNVEEPLRPIEELLNEQGSVTDPRSGQTFTFSRIGRYVWLDENVEYTGAGQATGPGLGRVYNYAEARRACPSGWRLPQRKEVADLLQHFGGNAAAYTALRTGANGIAPWPMAGKVSAQGNAIGTGRGGAYWTAQRIGTERAYALEFDHIARRADWKANYVSDYLSCRCVRE